MSVVILDDANDWFAARDDGGVAVCAARSWREDDGAWWCQCC